MKSSTCSGALPTNSEGSNKLCNRSCTIANNGSIARRSNISLETPSSFTLS